MAFTMATNAWCRNVNQGMKFKSLPRSGNGIASFAIDEYGRLWSWASNNDGAAGQGNYYYNQSAGSYGNYENLRIVSPRIVRQADGSVKDDWVKVMSSEWATMAIDKSGRLWGCGEPYGGFTADNCASFGLPHDSGEDEQGWRGGIYPRINYKTSFFTFTRCAPAYTFKDFAFCYYYTLMIGQDDRLYFMGVDDGYGVRASTTSYTMVSTPTLCDRITSKVVYLSDLGDFNYDRYGYVTEDNKVWQLSNGTITHGATIPTGKSPIAFYSTSYGRVLLCNDSTPIIMGASSVYMSVAILASINSVDLGMSQITSFALTAEGDLWSTNRHDQGSYITGDNVTDCRYAALTTAKIITNKKWEKIAYNYYNPVWTGIDKQGRLWTWGSNEYGPHLGIGTGSSVNMNTLLGIDALPVTESCVPVMCDIPDVSSVDFHWPRATPIPTPNYYDRS